MCFNQRGDVTTVKSGPLKLVDKFTYIGRSVLLTENDINIRLAKALIDIDRLSVIWKSDLSDKIKRSFFQAVVSILLYGCSTWTLTKRMEKKFDGNHTTIAVSCIEQVLEAIAHKTAAVRPLTTDHENHSS